MKKIVLTFGLISGAIMSSMMMLQMTFMDQIGFDKGMVIGYTTMVLAGLMIFFGVRSYRDTTGGGAITFGRAFRVGISIAGIAACIYVATWEVVYTKFMPDFGAKYTAHIIEKERASGASQAELDTKTKEMKDFEESYKNPLVRIGFTFLEPLPVALIMSLIAAGVLKRESRLADA